MHDTRILENAYKKFGDVAYVDHWFKATCFAPPIMQLSDNKHKLIDLNRTASKKTGKPFWWLPVIQLECRKDERLSMDEEADIILVTVFGKYIKDFHPKTAFDVERLARKNIKKDWRVEMIDGHQTCVFQRQGRNKWVLVEISKGWV